ncbi:hypothetical protein M2447_002442 [Ereboglobus sp. PH5-10]|nr:hypothetical protein [Ereboglobus sp. PH5-10]
MQMNSNNHNEGLSAGKCGRGFIRAGVLALVAAVCVLMAGCQSFRAWGESGSSSGTTGGGSLSIPLGKKR